MNGIPGRKGETQQGHGQINKGQMPWKWDLEQVFQLEVPAQDEQLEQNKQGG